MNYYEDVSAQGFKPRRFDVEDVCKTLSVDCHHQAWVQMGPSLRTSHDAVHFAPDAPLVRYEGVQVGRVFLEFGFKLLLLFGGQFLRDSLRTPLQIEAILAHFLCRQVSSFSIFFVIIW